MDPLLDALNELQDTAIEADKLAIAAKAYVTASTSYDEHIRRLVIQGLAGAIEKIYSGCERALEVIARDIDQKPIEKNAGWHRSLLLRMKNAVPGVRPAVLSDETYTKLDHLRSFRHRQRHTYGSDLRANSVLELVNEAVVLPKLVTTDIEKLASVLAWQKHLLQPSRCFIPCIGPRISSEQVPSESDRSAPVCGTAVRLPQEVSRHRRNVRPLRRGWLRGTPRSTRFAYDFLESAPDGRTPAIGESWRMQHDP